MTANATSTAIRTPSRWVRRFAPQVALRGTILDLACGGGRNGRHFLASGHAVTFLDKDIEALADLEDNPLAEIVCADLETGAPFPLQDHQFDGVVVTNYLWRDILSDICGAVAPGGLLIYETFGTGNEAYGRPRNPDFLLKPGELLETVGTTFDVLSYDHGLRCAPSTAVVQRIAAVKR